MKKVVAPSHLQSSTQHWFLSVLNKWTLDEHHERLLLLCCESWDRCTEARALIAKEGLVVDGRAHPAVKIEIDNRIAFARLLRELDLDLDPPVEAARPPALRSIRSNLK